jgi:hypothetical protein
MGLTSHTPETGALTADRASVPENQIIEGDWSNETISRRCEGHRLCCRGRRDLQRPRAVRAPGTMPPSRPRTGTSSNSPSPSPSPSPTSSSISALRGSRHLCPAGNGAAPLVAQRRAAAQVLTPAPGNARARTARDVRQPRSRALTAHPTPATLLG